jgi:hypothetical protein
MYCSVNQYVSSGSVVEVDDDDREETSSLVKECLRNGYRKRQTWTGDEHFLRGIYEYDPEYRNDHYDHDFDDTCVEDWDLI